MKATNAEVADIIMGIWDREPERAEECEAAIKDHVEKFYKMTKKR